MRICFRVESVSLRSQSQVKEKVAMVYEPERAAGVRSNGFLFSLVQNIESIVMTFLNELFRQG
jgi:hypothetical protein